MPNSLLNADSTHPKPWRPPTEVEGLFRVYDHDQINGLVPTHFKARHNYLVDTPFGERVSFGMRKGFMAGVLITFHECMWHSKLNAPRAVFHRTLYNVVPLWAATTSFVCAREALANVYERSGRDRESMSTYALAPLAPAAVFTAWKSVRLGVFTAIAGAMICCLYKEGTELGFWFLGQPPRRGVHHFLPEEETSTFGFIKKYDKPASYAKYVDETGKPLP